MIFFPGYIFVGLFNTTRYYTTLRSPIFRQYLRAKNRYFVRLYSHLNKKNCQENVCTFLFQINDRPWCDNYYYVLLYCLFLTWILLNLSANFHFIFSYYLHIFFMLIMCCIMYSNEDRSSYVVTVMEMIKIPYSYPMLSFNGTRSN